MRVAIIHDWLTGMRGGEKVLEVLCEMYPAADIYTLVCDKEKISDTIKNHKIITSYLQKIPGILKNYRNYLPMFPAAIESFNLKKYDLIVSSSHCVAKGVKHKKETPHVCYCHTPMRYAWDQFDNYFSVKKNGKLKFAVIKNIMPFLRKWDVKTAGLVSHYISNSEHVKKRIIKYYDMDAEVIYPPVNIEYYMPDAEQKRENFFLAVSALTEYKKIDFLVDAFNDLPDEKLVVIGEGPMLEKLKKQATGNITFLGRVSDDVIRDSYRRTKAFLFPGEEDFGITTAEAQACGAPVLALNIGGATEIVKEGLSGEFFDGTKDDFIKKLDKIRNTIYDVNIIRENAMRFSYDVFREKFKKMMENKVKL